MTSSPSAHRRWSPTPTEGAIDAGALVVMLVLASVIGVSRLDVVITVAAWVPLLSRHRLPEVAVAGTVALEGLRLALVPLVQPAIFTVLPIATIVAVSTFGATRRAVVAWPTGIAAAAVLLVVGLVQQEGYTAELMVMVDVVVVATAAGVLARRRRRHLADIVERAELAERTRDDEARRQVAAERVRIARELHDVLAHHLTLVNAQAGVADHLLATDPQAAAVALRGITRHTRQALDEAKVTIGLLRSALDATDGSGPEVDAFAPMPTSADVDDLVDGYRRAGGVITVHRTGTGTDLAPAPDLAAYRIVQESLTNTRRHAPEAEVEVVLAWSATGLVVEVVNGPPPAGRVAPDGPVGHGLMGMRERALAAGGALTAGPTPDGGWRVHATLPADGASSTAGATASVEAGS